MVGPRRLIPYTLVVLLVMQGAVSSASGRVHAPDDSKPLAGSEFEDIHLLIPQKEGASAPARLRKTLLDGGFPESRLTRRRQVQRSSKPVHRETAMSHEPSLSISPGCRGLTLTSPGKPDLSQIDERVKQWQRTVNAAHMLQRYLALNGWKAQVNSPDSELPLGTIAMSSNAQ